MGHFHVLGIGPDAYGLCWITPHGDCGNSIVLYPIKCNTYSYYLLWLQALTPLCRPFTVKPGGISCHTNKRLPPKQFYITGLHNIDHHTYIDIHIRVQYTNIHYTCPPFHLLLSTDSDSVHILTHITSLTPLFVGETMRWQSLFPCLQYPCVVFLSKPRIIHVVEATSSTWR